MQLDLSWRDDHHQLLQSFTTAAVYEVTTGIPEASGKCPQ
jgi:hypothetical protein